MLFSNPRVLPALLLCIGIALVYLRGQELEKLEQWNPSDLDTAVELNFALDLARMGPNIELSDQEIADHKASIRSEIQETFIEPRERLRSEYRQGIWITGAGLLLMVVVLLLQQTGILKKANGR